MEAKIIEVEDAKVQAYSWLVDGVNAPTVSPTRGVYFRVVEDEVGVGVILLDVMLIILLVYPPDHKPIIAGTTSSTSFLLQASFVTSTVWVYMVPCCCCCALPPLAGSTARWRCCCQSWRPQQCCNSVEREHPGARPQ